MDYKLKLAYDKIARKPVLPPYHLLEQTAFYQKDYEGTDAPELPGAEIIGVVKTPEKKEGVTNAIKAFAILDTVQDWLEQAGWGNSKLIHSRMLAEQLFIHKVHSNDVRRIVANRKNFNDLLVTIKRNDSFNLYKAIVSQFSSLLEHTTEENLFGLFDWLYNVKGDDKGTNVGPSEVLISLFSNSSKPAKGDLAFGDIIVEAKGNAGTKGGAALGYAPFAMERLRARLIELESDYEKNSKSNKKDKQAVGRKVHAVRTELRQFYADLAQAKASGASPAKSLITSKFFDTVDSIIHYIGTPVADKKLKDTGLEFINSQKLGSNASYEVVVAELFKRGYISKENEDLSLDEKPTNKDIVRVFRGTTDRGAVSFLFDRQQFAKKQGGDVSSTTEILQKATLGLALREFFLGGIERTKDEMLEALIYARPRETTRSDLQSSLEEILSDSVVEKLHKGSDSALNGIVFAIQLSEYAFAEEFDYILLSKQNSKKALSVPASENALVLFRFYEKHQADIEFKIVFSERQGAHSLGLK